MSIEKIFPELMLSTLKRDNSDFTTAQKWSVMTYSTQCRMNGDGKLDCGAMKVLTKRFDCHDSTVKRIIKEYDRQIEQGEVFFQIYLLSQGPIAA
jgi:hypothetical protein